MKQEMNKKRHNFLRFVDKTRLVREQFFIFNLVHISDTTTLTLKKQIFNVFCQHNLNM